MSDVNSSSQLRQAPANPGMARQPYPRPPGNGAAPAAQPRRSHSSTQYPAKYHFTTTIEAANAMNRLIRRKGFHLREVDHLRAALDTYLRHMDPQYAQEVDQ